MTATRAEREGVRGGLCSVEWPPVGICCFSPGWAGPQASARKRQRQRAISITLCVVSELRAIEVFMRSCSLSPGTGSLCLQASFHILSPNFTIPSSLDPEHFTTISPDSSSRKHTQRHRGRHQCRSRGPASCFPSGPWSPGAAVCYHFPPRRGTRTSLRVGGAGGGGRVW